MKKTISIKTVAVVLAVCLFASYVIYQCVLLSKSEMETQFTLFETVYKTIDAKGFVVRDEQFITNNTKGTTVAFAKNGSRVSANDTVSVVFNSADDAVSYLKITELQKELEHYRDLAGQANFQTVNIDSLSEKIDNELTDFLESRDKRDFVGAIESAEIFRNSLTGKQIATGSDLDFSKQVAQLQNELNELQKVKYEYTEIKSESSGYYISGADGYENIIDYKKIDSLTADDVVNAIKSEPATVASDVVGRVVGSFSWYVVCAVDTDKTVGLSYDNGIYVNFPYHGIEKLPVTLYKIGERTGDKTLIILSCDLMNDSYADLRIEDMQIITEEYSGYKIPNSAIRTVDNEKGVYVVRGNLLGFRKIHIIYTTDTYSIVDNPEGDSDYIKLYDKVVTKGVELYDNKLV